MSTRYDTDRYMRVAEVAAALNTAPSTVYGWCKSGYLTSRKLGGIVLVERATVFPAQKGVSA